MKAVLAVYPDSLRVRRFIPPLRFELLLTGKGRVSEVRLNSTTGHEAVDKAILDRIRNTVFTVQDSTSKAPIQFTLPLTIDDMSPQSRGEELR